jgi:HTH-type transcriptional regulator / antitoxin HigA
MTKANGRNKMLQPQVINNFVQTAHFLYVPTNESEYDQLVALLDELTDMVRDDEGHPLANLMGVLGVLIETYENEHIPAPKSDPLSVLKYFMEEYDLKQKDLSELGSQGVVSEILNGKRELNIRQIKALSERFQVPSSVFI